VAGSQRGSSGRRPAAAAAALVARARAVAARAHSPYSGVRVGAALLASDGRIFEGCNVENASYGLTICAERAAVSAAVAAGARQFEAIALWTNLRSAPAPCGACRQVLHEFAPRLAVLGRGRRGAIVATPLAELFPAAFGPRDLPRRRR
jgi:cytidine deaminase